MKEREYEQVSDDLAGFQARLRGEEPPAATPRPVKLLAPPSDPPTSPDAIPTLRIERSDDVLSVTHGDLTVRERQGSWSSQGADVIPMPIRDDDPVAEISERLEQLEMELTDVLHGLEDAEEFLGTVPLALPVEESSGDPLTDLQRLVARRMESDPER